MLQLKVADGGRLGHVGAAAILRHIDRIHALLEPRALLCGRALDGNRDEVRVRGQELRSARCDRCCSRSAGRGSRKARTAPSGRGGGAPHSRKRSGECKRAARRGYLDDGRPCGASSIPAARPACSDQETLAMRASIEATDSKVRLPTHPLQATFVDQLVDLGPADSDHLTSFSHRYCQPFHNFPPNKQGRR